MTGIVVVNTGNGKGKTTAALGMVMRAAGHGMRVLVLQFVKANCNTGEVRCMNQLEGVSVEVTGEGFIRDGDDLTKHKAAAGAALDTARKAVLSGEYDMVVLDEIMAALNKGLISEDEVADLIDSRPDRVHLILTGRDCPQSIADRAHIVTEMKEIKHAYENGVQGQKGVEY